MWMGHQFLHTWYPVHQARTVFWFPWMTRSREIGLAGNDPQESEISSKAGQTLRSFGKDLKTLMKHPVYVFSVLGSAVYTGISLPACVGLAFTTMLASRAFLQCQWQATSIIGYWLQFNRLYIVAWLVLSQRSQQLDEIVSTRSCKSRYKSFLLFEKVPKTRLSSSL